MADAFDDVQTFLRGIDELQDETEVDEVELKELPGSETSSVALLGDPGGLSDSGASSRVASLLTLESVDDENDEYEAVHIRQGHQSASLSSRTHKKRRGMRRRGLERSRPTNEAAGDSDEWANRVHKAARGSCAWNVLSLFGRDTDQRSDNIKYIVKAFGVGRWGTVSFQNHNQATYVRVAHDCEPSSMVDLMVKFGYNIPRLIITVTGGAKDFEIPFLLQQSLRRGLRKVVEATDAWILTAGAHCGVPKYIGETFNDIRDSLKDDRSLPLIGFMDWASVAGRQQLEESIQQQQFVVSYKENVASALDKNHSHFFLVEDTTEGGDNSEHDVQKKSEFEAEILARGEKENIIVYGVLLVIEGGPKSLKDIEQSVHNGVPVVVVEGSGRLSDIVAYAWRLLFDDSTKSRSYSRFDLRSMIRLTFPNDDPEVIQDRRSEKSGESCFASQILSTSAILYCHQTAGARRRQRCRSGARCLRQQRRARRYGPTAQCP
eukprot:m.219940 g.219940  ORF g.219940 m.219940 type:complete len:491 (-) comp10796_c0_seq2:1165-2637(-)